MSNNPTPAEITRVYSMTCPNGHRFQMHLTYEESKYHRFACLQCDTTLSRDIPPRE